MQPTMYVTDITCALNLRFYNGRNVDTLGLQILMQEKTTVLQHLSQQTEQNIQVM